MVRIQCSHDQASGSIPDWGTESLQATQHSKKKKKVIFILYELRLNGKRITKFTELSV